MVGSKQINIEPRMNANARELKSYTLHPDDDFEVV